MMHERSLKESESTRGLPVPITTSSNPKAYLETMRHLALPPEHCAMVAAHIYDLRAAGRLGMRTVYIRRPEEDEVRPEEVRAKAEGGEVDYVLDSFEGLAELAGGLVGGED
jgi:FMN phosphatase YigB (HAD superfamily)